MERLDAFVSRSHDISRAAAQSLIKQGAVTVDGKPAKNGQRVDENNAVSVVFPEISRPVVKDDKPVDLNLVFEDEFLAVIDKPAGMVVHPAPGHRDGTLADGLRQRGSTWSFLGGEERAGIVHRLDRDVSGLLVVAKTEEAHRRLAEQLADRTMGRTYWALVWGGFDEATATIEAPIGRDPHDRKKMAVQATGRDAVTDLEIRERFAVASIVDVKLRTGRTHQIRVHLAHIKHPIVGDQVYGRSSDRFKGRPALHARQLSFVHPVSGEVQTFSSPLPSDLRELVSIVSDMA